MSNQKLSNEAHNPKLTKGALMYWVAVLDRLPNHGEKVLTYTPDSDDRFQLQRVITFGSMPSGFPSGVTHWMHLPEPPCAQLTTSTLE